MDIQNVNEAGTLITFTSNEDTVIFPLPSIEPAHGGAFWCLPNFDVVSPFTQRHGEYRHTTGKRSEDGILIKTISGGWGELETKARWSFGETELTSHILLLSKKHETVVRPGFHPYLSLHGKRESYHLIIGDRIIESATILENMKMVVPCTSEENEIAATLVTGIRSIKLRFLAERKAGHIPLSFSFCLWTDQKTKYICIEPVCGISYDETGLPKPFTLEENEELKLSSTISFGFS